MKNAPIYIAEKGREKRRKIHHGNLRVNLEQSEEPKRIFHLAVSAYRPAPYTGRLVFFRAAETPPGDIWDHSRGWRELVKESEFKVHEVPGDHESMFRESNVETLANSLTRYLSAGESEEK